MVSSTVAMDMHSSTSNSIHLCRICGAANMVLVKASDVEGSLRPEDFAITNDAYGRTGAIFRCLNCQFMQCDEMPEVLQFYEGLEDAAYEEGRDQRLFQAQDLVRTILRACNRSAENLRLLDVGGGSGVLVEAAARLGIHAEGIEPSRSLTLAAREHGCRMHHGVLPHPQVSGPFDIVTLIDVIEHVTNPLSLFEAATALLAPSGTLVVVTPDASSIAARLMGWRWWHYRIAHVGYFNPKNLDRLCHLAGFRVTMRKRPGWYFSAGYLHQRLRRYVPGWLLPPLPRRMQQIVVPLNLFDSILVTCQRDIDSQR